MGNWIADYWNTNYMKAVKENQKLSNEYRNRAQDRRRTTSVYAYLSGTVLQGVESSNKMNMEAFFGFQIIKLLITCNQGSFLGY